MTVLEKVVERFLKHQLGSSPLALIQRGERDPEVTDDIGASAGMEISLTDTKDEQGHRPDPAVSLGPKQTSQSAIQARCVWGPLLPER